MSRGIFGECWGRQEGREVNFKSTSCNLDPINSDISRFELMEMELAEMEEGKMGGLTGVTKVENAHPISPETMPFASAAPRHPRSGSRLELRTSDDEGQSRNL